MVRQIPLRRDSRRGSVLVELALCAPLLLLLLAGTLDWAMLLRTATAVADAARAGAVYGSLTVSNSADAAGIAAAATNAAPGIRGMITQSTQSCQCAGGGAVSCSGSCGGGKQVYVAVTSLATAPTVFRYAGLPFSGQVQFTTRMRAQ